MDSRDRTDAFSNIFGTNRNRAAPVRQYPNQHQPTRSQASPALLSDPNRTRSLQQPNANVKVPPGHSAQSPLASMGGPFQVNTSLDYGGMGVSAGNNSGGDRAQSLSSSTQRPNFSRPATSFRVPSVPASIGRGAPMESASNPSLSPQRQGQVRAYTSVGRSGASPSHASLGLSEPRVPTGPGQMSRKPSNPNFWLPESNMSMAQKPSYVSSAPPQVTLDPAITKSTGLHSPNKPGRERDSERGGHSYDNGYNGLITSRTIQEEGPSSGYFASQNDKTEQVQFSPQLTQTNHSSLTSHASSAFGSSASQQPSRSTSNTSTGGRTNTMGSSVTAPQMDPREQTTRSYSMTSTSQYQKPNDRSFSFSGSTYSQAQSQAYSSQTTLVQRPSYGSGKSSGYSNSQSQGQAIYTTSKRPPMVYPALLSRVADAFRSRIILSDRQKDGLTYKDAFLGSDAVDVISYIIKTTDRNLALLLGRALDAQKFLHDVTYDHRLRDSANEVYQFRENLAAGFEHEMGSRHGDRSSAQGTLRHNRTPSRTQTVDSIDSFVETLRDPGPNSHVVEDDLPNGVFTLLTDCYSPTCTRDQLCYSIACPRRLEQQARLNMKPAPGLKRAESRGSLSGLDDTEKEHKLWKDSVSKDVAASVDEAEAKRQEIICEAIYTERDFVKDLEYLRDFWIKPLQVNGCIPEQRRQRFINNVFSNVLEVHSINSRLAEALTLRQQKTEVVHQIGDVFLEYIPHFGPFVTYGAKQLEAKFAFEKEKSGNPLFAKFVEETERLKESRKLELNGYLTKPTTRLARYPLLLEAIHKPTKDNNPDKHNLPKAVAQIKVFLQRVNAESGKAENRFNLMQINTQITWKPGDSPMNLRLDDASRQLIFKGALKKKNVGQSNAGTDASSDIQVLLFDHLLLMAKQKVFQKREQLRIHRKPIPLELLIISQSEDGMPSKVSLTKRPSSSLIPGTGKSAMAISGGKRSDSDGTKGFAVTFHHLGRRGYNITLFATNYVSRKKWIEHIESQQKLLRDRQSMFQRIIVCEKYFLGGNKVSCVVPYDGGRKLIYGTDNGIYVSERKPNSTARVTPVRVLAIQGATQIDVIEEYGILLVLQDKTLLSFSMDCLDANDNNLANKKPRKVSSHTNFFKAGVCLGRVLVCVVKSSVLSSTIKVLEPSEHLGKGKRQPAFRKLLAGGQDLKVFKEFYIPTESSSIHFLKSKLCVGCAKGFEVVSLENLETQSLLDPADSSLDFFQRRENVKPIAIYRMQGQFLLCYDEFAFFVNRNGWRAKNEWVIHWEGICEATAFHYPYILAFEPSFVEIYHVETGQLVQIIPGHNIRLLHEGRGKLGEGGEILFACDDGSNGDSVVNALSLTGAVVSPTRDTLE